MIFLNDYLLSVLLGVIEGLTEFLPVSSTAHLRISEALLGIDLGDGYWKMFSIVIQLGAILCLPIYFWKRIMGFLATFPQGARGDRTAASAAFERAITGFESLHALAEATATRKMLELDPQLSR